MSMETDRIEADLQDSRHRLSDTLDALGSKLSPGQMVDEVLGLAQGQAGHFTANLGRQVRDNPLPAVLIAAGALLLFMNRGSHSTNDENSSHGARHRLLEEARSKIARVSNESDEAYNDRLHDAYARALDLKQSAGEAVSDFKRRVAKLVEHTQHAGAEAGGQLSTAASGAAHAVKDQGRHLGAGISQTRHKAQDFFKGTPLAGGAIAVAIGALIGSATPLSEMERDKLGDLADQATRLTGDLAAKGARAVSDSVSNPIH